MIKKLNTFQNAHISYKLNLALKLSIIQISSAWKVEYVPWKQELHYKWKQNQNLVCYELHSSLTWELLRGTTCKFSLWWSFSKHLTIQILSIAENRLWKMEQKCSEKTLLINERRFETFVHFPKFDIAWISNHEIKYSIYTK